MKYHCIRFVSTVQLLREKQTELTYITDLCNYESWYSILNKFDYVNQHAKTIKKQTASETIVVNTSKDYCCNEKLTITGNSAKQRQ